MKKFLKPLAIAALSLWALVVTIPVAAQVYTAYSALDGSPSSPSFAFNAATNTGAYRETNSGAYSIAVAGTQVIRALAAGLGIMGQTQYKLVGAPPTISACGTATVSPGSTDSAGQVVITAGAPASCVVAFAATWTKAPFCYYNDATAGGSEGYKVTTSTTLMTITAATIFTGQLAAFGNDTLTYHCESN